MITALIGFSDSNEWKDTAGFHPALCESWSRWLKLIDFDAQAAELDGRICVHGVHGWSIGTKADGTVGNIDRPIGCGPNGEAITSSTWHAQDLEASTVGAKYPHLIGDFVEWMRPRGLTYRHMLAHVGAPSVEQAGTPMAKLAYYELKACGIIPVLDAQNAVASGGCAQEALTGLTVWGTEPGGNGPGGPIVPQLGSASYTLTSEGFWSRHFGRKPTPADLLVLPYRHDPAERVAYAAKAIGSGFCPCILVKPIAGKGWGEDENLSLKQVAMLMEMNG